MELSDDLLVSRFRILYATRNTGYEHDMVWAEDDEHMNMLDRMSSRFRTKIPEYRNKVDRE